MKTAVSLPDEVFEAAEELAQEMGVSRSRLYSRAIAEFVHRHGHDEVRERLDQVYGESSASLDPRLAELQGLTIGEDEW
jgi:metal-responsive CopG/Arc/MetJ family transcriptional regulator